MNGREPATASRIARGAHIGSAVVGGWLFVSAFLWTHAVEHMVSDALVGAVAVTSALAALYVRPQLRIVNIGLAAWLFVSLGVLPGPSVATLVNDLIVASLLLVLAVVPPERRSRGGHHPRPA